MRDRSSNFDEMTYQWKSGTKYKSFEHLEHNVKIIYLQIGN